MLVVIVSPRSLSMSPTASVAASLPPDIRQAIGIQVLSRAEAVSHLAEQHQVSRKFIYQQGQQAQQALDESFTPAAADDDVLFYLPVTKNWLFSDLAVSHNETVVP